MVVPSKEEIGTLNVDKSLKPRRYYHATIKDVREENNATEDVDTKTVRSFSWILACCFHY